MKIAAFTRLGIFPDARSRRPAGLERQKNWRAHILMAATIALLAGCSASRLTYRYDDPADPIVGEDYEYYPAHEAYYSPDDRTFIYRDGGSWVRSGDPPPGWQANSPSVRVHFRDSPEAHHQDVARRYPRTWRPPETRLGLEVDPRPSFDAKAER